MEDHSLKELIGRDTHWNLKVLTMQSLRVPNHLKTDQLKGQCHIVPRRFEGMMHCDLQELYNTHVFKCGMQALEVLRKPVLEKKKFLDRRMMPPMNTL